MEKNIEENVAENDIIEFIKPLENQFTIYSKSGCSKCKDVKNLLQEKDIQFSIIDCDEYLINYKPEFLNFIMELISMEWKTFPIVFDNTQFIGGFSDTKYYLEKALEFNEDF